MPQEVDRGQNNLVEVSFTKDDLLERILSPSNLNASYKRVVQNGGSGGVDDLGTEDLLPYLTAHKNELIASLLDGNFRPNPVRRVEIPKDNGQKRQLGVIGNFAPSKCVTRTNVI